MNRDHGAQLTILRRLCLVSLTLPSVFGQSTAEPLAFEVASVKPSPPDGSHVMGLYPGGRFVATGATLRILIELAYRIQPYQHKGGPGWLDSDRFDVIAQAGRSVGNDEVDRMLQTLLADRFKLAMHQDPKLLPGFMLVVAKHGPKLKGQSQGPFAVRPGPKMGRRIIGPASMQQLAESLGRMLGRPVVDKTGLPGHFDFSLDWTPDNPPAPANQPDLPQAPGAFTDGLLTALEDQLGLKLEPQKDLGTLYIIDHVERPSEN